jgi:hypothetical protein
MLSWLLHSLRSHECRCEVSYASPPTVRTANTPAADGHPGGKLGLGLRPLLIAMIHFDSNLAAASVAGSRSLRRNRVGPIMAISEARSCTHWPPLHAVETESCPGRPVPLGVGPHSNSSMITSSVKAAKPCSVPAVSCRQSLETPITAAYHPCGTNGMVRTD